MWLILLLFLISSFYYRCNGIFIQKRLGKNRREFNIYKIRSLPESFEREKNFYGKFIRKYKLDELPQLINVFIGDMSFVGPRPETVDYFSFHKEYPNKLFEIKPGMTGLASLYFYNEDILKEKNIKIDNVIFDQWLYLRKNKLNLIYYDNRNICYDLRIIFNTIIKVFF